jgi:guanine nucleotide-binding protein subunit alpha
MRVIHKVPFSSQETESYRQLVFNNLIQGLRLILEAMETFEITVTPENQKYLQLLENVPEVRDGAPFPSSYLEPLKRLWEDDGIRQGYARGNEAALPEKCVLYFFAFYHMLKSFTRTVYHSTRLNLHIQHLN